MITREEVGANGVGDRPNLPERSLSFTKHMEREMSEEVQSPTQAAEDPEEQFTAPFSKQVCYLLRTGGTIRFQVYSTINSHWFSDYQTIPKLQCN